MLDPDGLALSGATVVVTNPVRQGFGLGLSIVRELVHGQGGRVAVSSAPGEGSTFRVTLPVVPGPLAPDEAPLHQRPAGECSVGDIVVRPPAAPGAAEGAPRAGMRPRA